MAKNKNITNVLQAIDCDLRTFSKYMILSTTAVHKTIAGTLKMSERSGAYFTVLEQQLKEKVVGMDVLADYLAKEQSELKAHKTKLSKALAEKLRLLELKLSVMEGKYARCLEVLRNLSYITITAPGKVGNMHRRWHEVLIDKQINILENVGMMKQEELRKKIAEVRLGMG